MFRGCGARPEERRERVKLLRTSLPQVTMAGWRVVLCEAKRLMLLSIGPTRRTNKVADKCAAELCIKAGRGSR